MAQPRSSDLTGRMALAVILACAAVLRFHGLETPSLWWDEILVPLTAGKSLDYILDFCRFSEMHPPLFYLVSKAALGLGASDFSQRLLPAVLGTGSVWLLYRVTRSLTDKDTALLAAALLAVNGLHILLSREIRPYALQTVLLLAAWKLLMDLADKGRWRDLALLVVVNAALFWLHYFTFHLVFAQGVALSMLFVARSGRVDLARLGAFCAGTLIAALPVFVWFFLPSSGSRSIFSDTQYSRLDVLHRIADYLGQALFFFPSDWARWVAWALAALGALALATRGPRQAAVALALVCVPLLNLVALGKAAYFSPWHVAYAAPFLALFTASALARLPGIVLLAPAMALAGTAFILSAQHARYYEVDSYRHNVFVTLYKPMARTLAGMLPPGDVAVGSNPGFVNGVNWYLDRFVAPNPLRTQRIEPGSSPVTLRFVSAFNDYGALGGDEAAFLAMAGRPERVEKAQNATVYTFRMEREPAPRMERLPFEASLRAGLAGFYGRVDSLRDVVYSPMPGMGVTTTANARPGAFEWVVENGSGEAFVPLRFFVNLQYRNDGRGNVLALSCRFDDEERVPLAGTLGPDPKRQAQAVFHRDRPFRRLTFIVEMLCDDRTAQYHGGNLETLAFRGLDVYACPDGEPGSCQEAWERTNMESMRLNFGPQSFMVKGTPSHRPLWESAVNLADTPSPEVPGWNVLGPRDQDAPAVLRVELGSPGKGLVFYPRLSGPADSVLVFEEAPGGDKPVFMMTGAAGGEWTPISAQYPLVLDPGPGGRTLRVELRGRYAQLWHRGGNILFNGFTR